MNRTSNIILGVLVAAAIIGGIYYFATREAAITPVSEVQTPSPTPTGQTSGAPTVATKSANYISQSTAVLDAGINPNGAQTSYWYEYGTTQSLGSVTSAQLLGAGNATYSAPGFITGLKSNTTYYYRAVAQNANGRVNGSVSSFTTTITVPVPGNPPTAETTAATNIDTDEATLTGRVNSQGSKTYYWFEYGNSLALGNTTASSTTSDSGTISVTKDVSGLNDDTVYYFRLNAQNGYGTVNGPIRSFTTKTTTPPPAPQGDEPTADTDPATSISAGGATLNGHVNPNGSETTYWFEYGRASLLGVFNLTEKTAEKSAGAAKASKAVSTAISGLDDDATYYFRIVTKNKYGTDSGSIHRFTTKAK